MQRWSFDLEWGDDLSAEDPFIQRRGLWRWLFPQLVRQHLAARLVLRQGGTGLTAERQQAHQSALGSLPPRIQFHLPPGVSEGGLVLRIRLVTVHQVI